MIINFDRFLCNGRIRRRKKKGKGSKKKDQELTSDTRRKEKGTEQINTGTRGKGRAKKKFH